MDHLALLLLKKVGGLLAKAKPGEFAPGIPAAKDKAGIPQVERFGDPVTWQFVDHRHEAVKAGPHTDLRLSDGQKAYSWAVRSGIPLVPGEKVEAVRQPDHDPAYLSFEGQIPAGYGKTKGRGVWIGDKGPARILSANDTKINFALLHKQNPLQFVLVKKEGDQWLLANVTPTTQSRPNVPQSKPKYKEAKPEEFEKYLSNGAKSAVLAKLDGAHVTLNFDRKTPEVYSYRPSERQTGLINHTFLAGLERTPVPDELRGMRLRGEIYAAGKDGKPIPNRELAGLLNSSPMKGLETLKEKGLKIRFGLFDVVSGPKGKPMEDVPWGEKREVLQQAVRVLGRKFHIPDTATTAKKQKELFERIEKGEHPTTDEGVVIWNLNQAGPPTKIKFRPHQQVYVHTLYEGAGKYEGTMGRYSYSLTPKGAPVGFVGTGFDDAQRKWMWEHRNELKGRKVVIKSQEQFPSGAYRAPSHEHLHM